MDRLAKKCVIASSLLHGTLVLVLLVGPAFLTSNRPPSSKDIIDFIPAVTINEAMTGGGNPNVPNVPPPQQLRLQQQQAQPTPPPPVKNDPVPKDEPKQEPKKITENTVKPIEREDKPDPDALEATPKSRKPKVDLTRKVTNPAAKANAKAKSEAAAAERAQANAEAKQRQDTLKGALSSIRNNTGASVKIDEMRGPGGGGLPYAGFNQALVSVYMRNWLIPAEAADSSAVVVTTITISREGKVISARIAKPSGNADLDKSVQRALDRVDFVAPFPAGTTESQRTFWLEFDPKAKNLMG